MKGDMSSDFFDEDLVRTARSGGNERAVAPPDTMEVALEKKRWREHEEALTTQLSGAARQLEELRLKRAALEQAREDLETLGRKQQDYARRKRELLHLLDRGLESMGRREHEAARLLELIEAVRHRFSEALADLNALREDDWSRELFSDELDQALRRVEEAEAVYRAGQSKLAAEDWSLGPAGRRHDFQDRSLSGEAPMPGFRAWLTAGVAFSLPIAGLILICFLAWMLQARGLF